MVILITVDAIANPQRILTMLLVRITGSQLRAGRALAGLTIEDLAVRARLCRHSVRKWEGSSNAVPDAMVAHLGTHMLRPGNDPEVVARKLLREKRGRTSFYAAISYPHWGR
jgi:hypothetical protein